MVTVVITSRWRRAARAVLPGALAALAVACTETVVAPVDVALVQVEPQAVRVTAGDTVRLSAVLKDAAGNPLPGRPVVWSSSDLDVATVDDNGLVRAVGRGSASVTATSDRVSGSASVDVDAAPLIVLQQTSVAFEATAHGADPPARSISVTNGGDVTLAGLTVSVRYDSGAGGWLQATLSATTAPATLTLRARTAGLSPGSYAATVEVSSTLASNSPRTVSVTFEVGEPGPEPPPAAPQNLRVTNEAASHIALAWNHDGAATAEYRLERRTEGSANWQELAVIGAPANAHEDRSVQKATTYHYRIRACNVAGACSGYSNQVSGTTRGN